jgi:hypothetical protein
MPTPFRWLPSRSAALRLPSGRQVVPADEGFQGAYRRTAAILAGGAARDQAARATQAQQAAFVKSRSTSIATTCRSGPCRSRSRSIASPRRPIYGKQSSLGGCSSTTSGAFRRTRWRPGVASSSPSWISSTTASTVAAGSIFKWDSSDKRLDIVDVNPAPMDRSR